MTSQLHNRVERLWTAAGTGAAPLVLRIVEGESPGSAAQRLADYLRRHGHHPIAVLPSKCASDEEWIAVCATGGMA